MIKKLSKIGNSRGIIFDAVLMEQAHLKEGDEVNVTVHQGGSITLTPIRRVIDADTARSTAKRLISKNSDLFTRLS
ncbi:MAG: AbrB/MazE/SpoVT family DNA-binding domain-containing protein [Opitutales bacterium]